MGIRRTDNFILKAAMDIPGVMLHLALSNKLRTAYDPLSEPSQWGGRLRCGQLCCFSHMWTIWDTFCFWKSKLADAPAFSVLTPSSSFHYNLPSSLYLLRPYNVDIMPPKQSRITTTRRLPCTTHRDPLHWRRKKRELPCMVDVECHRDEVMEFLKLKPMALGERLRDPGIWRLFLALGVWADEWCIYPISGLPWMFITLVLPPFYGRQTAQPTAFRVVGGSELLYVVLYFTISGTFLRSHPAQHIRAYRCNTTTEEEFAVRRDCGL
jgi:hypothetical protein